DDTVVVALLLGVALGIDALGTLRGGRPGRGRIAWRRLEELRGARLHWGRLQRGLVHPAGLVPRRLHRSPLVFRLEDLDLLALEHGVHDLVERAAAGPDVDLRALHPARRLRR